MHCLEGISNLKLLSLLCFAIVIAMSALPSQTSPPDSLLPGATPFSSCAPLPEQPTLGWSSTLADCMQWVWTKMSEMFLLCYRYESQLLFFFFHHLRTLFSDKLVVAFYLKCGFIVFASKCIASWLLFWVGSLFPLILSCSDFPVSVLSRITF